MEKKRHVIALAGQKKLYGEMELLSNRLQYESSFLDFDLIVLTLMHFFQLCSLSLIQFDLYKS